MNKISIITVCYNCKNDIEKTILSVINQTYTNIEYIIIDGSSTDGTLDIITKYKKQISIIISEPDKGIYDAMNKGIALATGDWINFMNAGDTFYNNTVLEDIFSNNNYPADIIYGHVEYDYGFTKVIKKPAPINSITRYMGFSHQSTFVKTNIMKDHPYNLHYKIIADYDFFLSRYKEGYIFKEIPNIVATYERANGVSSGSNFKQYKKHIKELDQLGVLRQNKTIIYAKYLIKSYIKSFLPHSILSIFYKKNR